MAISVTIGRPQPIISSAKVSIELYSAKQTEGGPDGTGDPVPLQLTIMNIMLHTIGTLPASLNRKLHEIFIDYRRGGRVISR